MATINGQKKQQTAKTNNSAAGYTYTPGGSSGTGGNSLTNAVKTATSTMKTSSGTSKTDNVSSGAVQANGLASSGGKTSGGSKSAGGVSTPYDTPGSYGNNFTMGAGGIFTDAGGKTYSSQDYTLQGDGTIRNNKTGQVLSYDGTGQGGGGAFTGTVSAYGPDGNMLSMASQQEKDFLANAKPGETMSYNGMTYTKNSDGGVTARSADGMIFHTVLPDTGGKWSQPDQQPAKQSGTGGGEAGQTGGKLTVGNGQGATYEIQKQEYKDWLKTARPGQTLTTGDGATITMGENGTFQVVTRDGHVFGEGYIPKGGTAAQGTGQNAGQSNTGGQQSALDLSAYDSAWLSPQDQAAVKALKEAYQAAKDRGDRAGMEHANDQANAIRAMYGYSGGGDGASLTVLNQEAKTMDGLTLPEYRSAAAGANYTPMAQNRDWTAGLNVYDGGSLPEYQNLAGLVRTQDLQAASLPQVQSQYGNISLPQQAAQEQMLGRTSLQNYDSAVGQLAYSPVQRTGEQAIQGTVLPAYQSPLLGMGYQNLAGTPEQAMGNIDLGSYQAGINSLQYTPMAGQSEEALERTVLPGYQSSFEGMTAPELAKQQYQQMQNAVLQGYQAQTGAVNDLYDAAAAADLAQLKSAYDSARAQAERSMAEIGSDYQQKRNAIAAENEKARLGYMEQAAASGLNAGNRSQAALAFSNQLQNNLGQLNTAEAKAVSDARFQLDRLYSDYQNQISEAIAKNNYEKAAALLQEYQTAQQSAVDTASRQADLNLRTADFNRQTANDQTANRNLDFQNQLALAQARQTDRQAAANQALQQANLDLQTAAYNREGRQMENAIRQQDWQNQLALTQAQDAALQDAYNRAYQQAALNMQVADYNRQGREMDRQAQQQDYANRLALAQAQDAAQEDAWNRAYQQAGLDLQTEAFNREGRSLDYEAARQNQLDQLAFAQAQDAARQQAWNRALDQANLDLQTEAFNREGRTLNNQNLQQAYQNQMDLARALEDSNQNAYNRAYQQAELERQAAEFNRQNALDYWNAASQDQQNQLAWAQEQRAAQEQAYQQQYLRNQLAQQGWNDYQQALQNDWQNQTDLWKLQDDEQQALIDRAYRQADLDMGVWDRNQKAEQDRLAQQQQYWDNQRTLSDEQLRRDELAWKQAEAEADRAQQKWDNEFAITELGAKYNDFNRLAYYGYTPEQIQQMYRFAQMDKVGNLF